MDAFMKQGWTEEELRQTLTEEHDYIEWKSGRLFDDNDELLTILAKALSAFANSGGGHVVLGVANDGTLDGAPPTFGKSRTTTREWLEQKIPHLVSYPLAKFRVHVVQRSQDSDIPRGRDVLVIDVGDSPLAPHQCAYGSAPKLYYYRQGGRSEPAPHFYLELLRQRLTGPVLEVSLTSFQEAACVHVNAYGGAIVFVARLEFTIRNTGRIAAYRWKILLEGVEGYPADREADFAIHPVHLSTLIERQQVLPKNDQTILPGTQDIVVEFQPFVLRPGFLPEMLNEEIRQMIYDVRLRLRLATETSPGEEQLVPLAGLVNWRAIAASVSDQRGHPVSL